MSVRLLHLTDPHLSSLDGESWWKLHGKRRLGYLSWYYKRRHHLRADVLARVTTAACGEGADLAVVTGDLVQLGLTHEIAAARIWLEDLRRVQPVLLVPGNHDCYQSDSWYELVQQLHEFTAGATHANAGMPSLVQLGEVSVIGLWSARAMPWWSAGGWLGPEQLTMLEQLLVQTAGSFRCVLLHHAPMREQAPPRKALRDAAALRDILARQAVELVLHGHLHHNDVRPLNGRARVIVTAAASSASTTRPASYRVIEIAQKAHGWQVKCELKSLDTTGHIVRAGYEEWEVARTPGPFSAGG